jgi:hypothetical protein
MDDAANAVGRPRKYDDETYELAFELWGFFTNRNAAKVAELLRSEEYGCRDVPARTIQAWAKEDTWPDKLRERVGDILPDMINQTITNFALIAYHGSHRIAESLQEHGKTIPQRTDQDGNPVTTLDVPVDKTLIAAVYGAADRLGLSPLGKTTAPKLRRAAGDEVAKALPDLAGKSADELEAIERAYLDGRK